MSGRSKLREDKTCLNCGHEVEERFCPHCGQENTDTRKTFHHLFIHFFEDLTHYENAFWKTIRHLLFRPARLTKEYLSGKRLSYLAPVRLYIFISFVTFFIIALLHSPANNVDNTMVEVPGLSIKMATPQSKGNDSVKSKAALALKKQDSAVEKLVAEGVLSNKQADTLNEIIARKNGVLNKISLPEPDMTVQQLDSIRKFGRPEQVNTLEYWFERKYAAITSNNTYDEILEKFQESFTRNFPKILFLYMPIFALFLYIFHGKKRWYYFDHGIFTLHYFSFLLLIALIINIVNWLLSYCGTAGSVISYSFSVVSVLWALYYFFPAHHRFYGESRIVSFFKSIVLLIINIFIIVITLVAFATWTLLSIH